MVLLDCGVLELGASWGLIARSQSQSRARLLVDLTASVPKLTFIEPVVDPDYKYSWLLKKGGLSYAWERTRRFMTTQK